MCGYSGVLGSERERGVLVPLYGASTRKFFGSSETAEKKPPFRDIEPQALQTRRLLPTPPDAIPIDGHTTAARGRGSPCPPWPGGVPLVVCP